jgi:hypothetical protein
MPWTLTGHRATLIAGSWSFSLELDQPQAGIAVVRDVEAVAAGRSADPTPAAAEFRVCQLTSLPAHAAEIEDAFTRYEDLIVRYAQSAQDQFGFQLDVRRIPDAELGGFEAGLEIWLSVQTQLLDTHPTFQLRHAAVQPTANQPAGGVQLACAPLRLRDGQPVTYGHSNNENSHSDEQAVRGGLAAGLCGLSLQAAGAHATLLIHPTDQVQAAALDGPSDGRSMATSDSGSDAQPAVAGLQLLGAFMEKGVIRRMRLRYLFAAEPTSPVAVQQAYQCFAESALPLTA